MPGVPTDTLASRESRLSTGSLRSWGYVCALCALTALSYTALPVAVLPQLLAQTNEFAEHEPLPSAAGRRTTSRGASARGSSITGNNTRSSEKRSPIRQTSGIEGGGLSDDESLGEPASGRKPWEVNSDDEAPDDAPIVAIQVEGNISIPEANILRYIKCRRGRPATSKEVREDVRALFETRWFTEVSPIYRQTDKGLVLVFRVHERPILESVTYIGNKHIKTRFLEGVTGLRKGGAFSVAANRDAVKGIERYYTEKGYYFSEITLKKGASEDDREVIFEIKEGPKTYVSGVQFIGNSFFSASLLKTKLKTSPRIIPYIGGKYVPTDIEDDVASLREYYHKLGFFDAKISAKPEFTADKSSVSMIYEVAEGTRYQIGKIVVQGTAVLSENTLRKDFTLAEGEYFNRDKLERDIDGMTNKYGELGRLFAEVNAKPIFREREGIVDIVYSINEDRVYRIRRIDVVINGGNGSTSHTKDTVVLNSLLVAPGDLANKVLIDKSSRRLRGMQIFDSNVLAGTAPKIDVRPVEGPGLLRSGDGMARAQGNDQDARPVQRTAKPYVPLFPVPVFPKSSDDIDNDTEQPGRTSLKSDKTKQGQSRRRIHHHLRRVFDEPLEVQLPEHDRIARDETVIRAQGPGLDGPPASNPLMNNFPDGNPYGNPMLAPADESGWVDLAPQVTETQTGRISFGVGVNSDAGFLGNAIIDESNFDILRVPTSFRDILDGTAFRGGGQQFRAEAVPGNRVSRYMLSWRDPFFLDTNYSLGVSGFYYTRIFEYWDETRAGGKVTLGRQFDPFLSGLFSLRLEDVNLDNITTATPPTLLAKSIGHSLLSTARVGLVHDTRDSAFLPTEGHYIEGGYEQAFGDFNYARLDLIARRYFTVYQRPDGEGRHIVALNGQASYTGDNTPIYERLYAGGFSSFRGFQFRGVTPVDNGVGVGGQWMALGSVEYIFPVTASENLRGVVFTDFGTVEKNVAFNDFRASAGVGMRLTVPAMGPLPIALDLAWPLASQDFDKTRMFSFYVGFLR